MNTTGLFPIPISIKQLSAIPKDVVDFAKGLEYIPWGMSGANGKTKEYSLSMTNDRQVLDQYPIFQTLKGEIMAAAYEYWHDVICADRSLNLKIRHSWITRHSRGEKNPEHVHTASLFTATVYLQAPKNCGNLIFKKDNNYLNLFPLLVDIDYHTNNLINTKHYSVTPEAGKIVFFPSHLAHETKFNESDEDRYALNIDFWFEGTTRKNSKGFDVTF